MSLEVELFDLNNVLISGLSWTTEMPMESNKLVGKEWQGLRESLKAKVYPGHSGLAPSTSHNTSAANEFHAGCNRPSDWPYYMWLKCTLQLSLCSHNWNPNTPNAAPSSTFRSAAAFCAVKRHQRPARRKWFALPHQNMPRPLHVCIVWANLPRKNCHQIWAMHPQVRNWLLRRGTFVHLKIAFILRQHKQLRNSEFARLMSKWFLRSNQMSYFKKVKI